MDKPVLALEHVTQAYGERRVVKDLTLALDKDQIGCLLGPSGCGKTTTLRIVAGFEPLLAGRVSVNGTVVSRPDWLLPPEKRAIGMVFQDYALFPHLSVQDNIGFGLLHLSRRGRRSRIGEVLELVGLSESRQCFPHELSGGQQQRVALARALAPRPALLLMDEPFSNLDVTLRDRLALEVRQIIKSYGATALFVTHNQQEAFAIADRIGVMDAGELRQWDSVVDLYRKPADPQVACFIGEGTLVPGRATADGAIHTELGLFFDGQAQTDGGPVQVLLRPEDIYHDESSEIKARIIQSQFRGANMFCLLETPSGQQLQALFPGTCEWSAGQSVGISTKLGKPVCFPLDLSSPPSSM
ncbi:ferrous iron ABC transporter, ATP-binding protein [Syntrophotalea carbinolica DSM 2380]|uniref:Ferrous iron ABC transporter, ATP-binding protein n=1 Tax=Syntrophotalea carbinolica (strain DSM 2380 / NBRC 103641 / GraBd1) TaxID=338963 RepID=Q3A657_SYNC1|nr:ABC transporter ATP-binding protein [Syntrophotalea carbinolica]ABA88150.1 ferrous iron ABC transporter, ATP-binding protein [Syntrophotalea carbinolica DSM 2380]